MGGIGYSLLHLRQNLLQHCGYILGILRYHITPLGYLGCFSKDSFRIFHADTDPNCFDIRFGDGIQQPVICVRVDFCIEGSVCDIDQNLVPRRGGDQRLVSQADRALDICGAAGIESAYRSEGLGLVQSQALMDHGEPVKVADLEQSLLRQVEDEVMKHVFNLLHAPPTAFFLWRRIHGSAGIDHDRNHRDIGDLRFFRPFVDYPVVVAQGLIDTFEHVVERVLVGCGKILPAGYARQLLEDGFVMALAKPDGVQRDLAPLHCGDDLRQCRHTAGAGIVPVGIDSVGEHDQHRPVLPLQEAQPHHDGIIQAGGAVSPDAGQAGQHFVLGRASQLFGNSVEIDHRDEGILAEGTDELPGCN